MLESLFKKALSRTGNFITKRFQNRFFPLNIEKCLRKHLFLHSISGGCFCNIKTLNSHFIEKKNISLFSFAIDFHLTLDFHFQKRSGIVFDWFTHLLFPATISPQKSMLIHYRKYKALATSLKKFLFNLKMAFLLRTI